MIQTSVLGLSFKRHNNRFVVSSINLYSTLSNRIFGKVDTHSEQADAQAIESSDSIELERGENDEKQPAEKTNILEIIADKLA